MSSWDRLTAPLLTAYAAVSLVVAAVFLPPALSPLPLLMLGLLVFARVRLPRRAIGLALDVYIFLVLPLLYEQVLSPALSSLLSLPLLGLVDADLRGLSSLQAAPDWRFRWRPSRMLFALATIAVASVLVSWLLGRVSTLLSGAFLGGYLLLLVIRVFRAMPALPIEASVARHRVVAGSRRSFTVALRSRFALGGWLELTAPHDWVRLAPARLPLAGSQAELRVSLTPPLSGPSSVSLTGFVLDRWGLLQLRTELEVARLQVVPRARYALWLARRYLETSRTEAAIPVALSLAVSRRTVGSRGGIEYYGSRSYQPGDSLRSIDWKRSLKLDEIVVKEYDLPRVTAALLLVNAAASSAEEADRLVHAWLTTAITLAREGVPASLAVYDQRQVLATTGFLGSRELVSQSLVLSGHVTLWAAPARYLQAAPDLVRLRGSSRRLKAAGGHSAARLAELLDAEFAALRELAASSPATWALSRALQKASTRPTVLFLSARNHDAEALAVARYELAARQYDCAEVSLSAGGDSLS